MSHGFHSYLGKLWIGLLWATILFLTFIKHHSKWGRSSEVVIIYPDNYISIIYICIYIYIYGFICVYICVYMLHKLVDQKIPNNYPICWQSPLPSRTSCACSRFCSDVKRSASAFSRSLRSSSMKASICSPRRCRQDLDRSWEADISYHT